MSDLGAAVNEAVALGAKFVSNSYGGTESAATARSDSAYFNHPGVAITASSGDGGYGVLVPGRLASTSPRSAAPRLTTRVQRARLDRERPGPDAGIAAARSTTPSRPGRPTPAAPRRTVADVSAVADPATGVAVYDTYGESGWLVYGGTSRGLADHRRPSTRWPARPAPRDRPASYPYAHTGSLFDVTRGANGSCSPAYLCTAGSGYDGPTGLGTPNGFAAFAATSTVSVVALHAHANGDYVQRGHRRHLAADRQPRPPSARGSSST